MSGRYTGPQIASDYDLIGVKLADGGASILDFSDYCRRHLIPTYPYTK